MFVNNTAKDFKLSRPNDGTPVFDVLGLALRPPSSTKPGVVASRRPTVVFAHGCVLLNDFSQIAMHDVEQRTPSSYCVK